MKILGFQTFQLIYLIKLKRSCIRIVALKADANHLGGSQVRFLNFSYYLFSTNQI